VTKRQYDESEITAEMPAIERAPSVSRERKPYLVAIAGLDVGSAWEVGPRKVIGRGESAHIVVSGAEVSRRHAEVWADADGIWIRDLGSSNGTVVNGRRIECAQLCEGDRIEIGASTVLRLSFHDEVEAAFHARLRDSATRDPLTGLYNRRCLEERMPGEIAYARRHRRPLAVLLFDVDHFKAVNDRYGHLAGDAVLIAIARLVQQSVRTEDLVVRYGGEEFLILGRSLDGKGAGVFAERLRALVEALPISYGEQRIGVTISVGVAIGPNEADRDGTTLLRRADEALYEAKRRGRNRVCVAP
jgi:diguanylate cyclase (GGDEF)-like protein